MEEYERYRKLLSAVVGLAVRDACQTPGKKMLNQLPRDALDFIFNHSDGYLEWLDFDPEQFRKKLVSVMYTKNPNPPYSLSQEDCRNLRINYQMWCNDQR